MSEIDGKKKFRLFDAILAVICVVFVAEAAAPVAAIGNSQYFWWIFLIITFLLPYGLIASELGTTYNSEGGLYDWIKKAFGAKWGGRASWYYWINFPLWMASLAVMFPEIIGIVLGQKIGLVPSLLIELVFIWIIVFISFFPVCDSVWILNGAAIIKVLLALVVGGFGIYGAVTKGVANEYTFASLLPSFDLKSLSFISVILFNFLGFEVVCTFADTMKNPKKQIPQSIIVGGIIIAAIYIFSAFGIGVAIPTQEVSTSSGLIESLQLLTGKTTGIFIGVMSVLFLLTLFGNMVSWSLGVNNVASYAALNGDMPAVFAKRSRKNDMPAGASIMNGIVASLIVVLSPLLPNQDLFWSFFALNLVMFLMAYLPIFPAFLKLRKVDPDTERPFKVSGNNAFLRVLAITPMVLIIIALVFLALPLSFDAQALEGTLPITIGSIVCIMIGEIIIRLNKKNK
ncbi:APC family permease [Anaerocolumna xylanovorans]|uniref:Agmatine:putrescine antiporter, APC superfamily n=1 Tax=Anaerocolumna xylanovorans DSM 12503 TaxID=1121345 RepID=A0A1M7XZ35_9FIRM|nr:APC family permease [Anaerocolumna xylanovorans]SHO44253.1 agmatine:putrescine antiporter, APC superfamily [Anaerocolumna xylanovorans DSM 12503]